MTSDTSKKMRAMEMIIFMAARIVSVFLGVRHTTVKNSCEANRTWYLDILVDIFRLNSHSSITFFLL